MTGTSQDCLERIHYPLVRFLYDCLAAQTEWARSVNVLQQKDVFLVPLTRRQQARLGRHGSLSLASPAARELGDRFATGGSEVWLRLGALFLVGTIPATGDKPARRYCAPLLEVPLGLQRDLSKRRIVVEPEEVEFSVNYSLVSEILRTGREDLQDRLTDLAELVPDFPIDAGEFRDFWNGFRMIAAGMALSRDLPRPRRRRGPAEQGEETGQAGEGTAGAAAATSMDSTGDDAPQRSTQNVDESKPLELVDFYVPSVPTDGQFRLLPATAILLGRRTGQVFSALDELDGMLRQPLDQTAFGCVFDPASARPPAPEPATETVLENAFPLPLTATQEAVVRSARSAPLTVVTGPPGTGKSYTITAIVLDALLRGQTVLVASQMDQAVEVVYRQVEEIAGPFAMARSGGRAAQRELADKITRLTGPQAQRHAVTVEERREIVLRHGGLSQRLAALEKRYRRAIAAERRWSESRDAFERLAPICPLPIEEISARSYRRAKAAARRARAALAGEPPAIRLPVHATSLRTYVQAKRAARRARELLEGRPGRVRNWWGSRHKRRFFRLFGLSEIDCSIEDIDQALRHWWGEWNKARAVDSLRVPHRWDCALEDLDETILVQGHFTSMKEAEREFPAPFPADLLWEEIRHLERSRTGTALELLRRNREATLHRLTGDHERRRQLRQFRTLLRRRNRKLKRELREQMDLAVPLSAFPAWACTNRTLGQILPATAAMFDLVVIDEATQCELASASVALLRGKRAVVVGDPQQLTHVCFLGKAREQASFAQHGLNKQQQERFRYRRSLFDVAADAVAQDQFFLLDQHFRSDPHIIDFSNRKFYERQLRIMTERPRCQAHRAIRLVQVEGRRSAGTSVNRAEVEATLREMAAVIEGTTDDEAAPTLGVVCPFRDQVDAIREGLVQRFPSAAIDRHRIVVGTAHSLQGDEKDVVILTTSIDPGFHVASLRFLENPNLFNVAVTRARRELLVVTSVTTGDLPAGLLKDYLQHAQTALQPHPPTEHYDHDFERLLAAELKGNGREVWPNFLAAGVRIDLVAAHQAGHVGILCDGPPTDPADTIDPLTCHRLLARAGWTVKRIPRRSWLADRQACLDHVFQRAAT